MKYLKEHKSLSDVIHTKEKLKAIEFTKISYDIEKTKQEVAHLKKNKELLEKDNQLLENNRVRASLNKELAKKNQQIEKQNERLEEYNKDLQQFAYVASHDLKSPMRTMKSYLTLLTRKHKKHIPEEGKVYLDYIEEAISKMQGLLKETLLFAKSRNEDHTSTTHVAVRPVLKDCLRNLKTEIEENNAIIYIQKEAFPKVECNTIQLLQVFQNLISNAIKFRGSEHPRINISCTVKGSFCKFSIKDNGIGIPSDAQSNIFEMFTRAQNNQKQEGNGIGLATCKKIINYFGGNIWVQSNEQGSNFFFTLPIARKYQQESNNKEKHLVSLKR